MKISNFKRVLVLLLSFAIGSSVLARPTTLLSASAIHFNDEYGKFQLAIKNISAALDEKQSFTAYVKISSLATGDIVMNTVISVKYRNGQLVSGLLELPLGTYKLEQMILLPSSEKEENVSIVKMKLPYYFTVSEK
ncbi:MAG TPA: hypothetical protein VGN63_00365 [Flavisolibacter sp.]|jgi:hypothetical protein|nr:hypothetical protein [Flavisolibacter sp.]